MSTFTPNSLVHFPKFFDGNKIVLLCEPENEMVVCNKFQFINETLQIQQATSGDLFTTSHKRRIITCPTCLHIRYEAVIEKVNNTLYGLETDDAEHDIACHADTVNKKYLETCRAVEKVREYLASIVCEWFD